jgi:hypothetical protein
MLFGLFILLTGLHFEVLREFGNGSFYDDEDGLIAGYSLGNLGFS